MTGKCEELSRLSENNSYRNYLHLTPLQSWSTKLRPKDLTQVMAGKGLCRGDVKGLGVRV